ncbi:MAG: MurR/RpiR family transcriptional regulator [Allobaculum sp.]
MIEMSCYYKIREAYDSLTNTDKTIADYILKNKRKIILMSSQALGQETKTSAAAWIRFAQHMGYKGLSALKADLTIDDDDEDVMFDVLISDDDSVEVLVKKMHQLSLNNSAELYKLINVDALEDVINHTIAAEKIYLLGVGGSGIVCMDFMEKLYRIGKEVIFNEDSHVLISRLAHITERDMVIAVSYSGETNIINDSVKYAKEQGAYIAAITQYNLRSTLVSLADTPLYTPVVEKELRIGSIFSRNSAIALTDLIFCGLLKEDFDKHKQSLIKTRELIRKVDKK